MRESQEKPLLTLQDALVAQRPDFLTKSERRQASPVTSTKPSHCLCLKILMLRPTLKHRANTEFHSTPKN